MVTQTLPITIRNDNGISDTAVLQSPSSLRRRIFSQTDFLITNRPTLVMLSRLHFNNVTRKRQHTNRLLNLSVGHTTVAGFHFFPGPISPDRMPAPGDTGSVHLLYNNPQSAVLPASIGHILRAVIEYRASGSREQGHLDSSLETYFHAKSSPIPVPFRPAQKYLYDELTTPKRPIFRIRREETYQEFIERLPWPNTSPRLRQAFHDDLTPSCWWMQPQQAFLKLYDATNPDPAPFLKYCDAISAISEMDKSSINLKKRLIKKVRAQCKDALVILRYKDFQEDARWLDTFAS